MGGNEFTRSGSRDETRNGDDDGFRISCMEIRRLYLCLFLTSVRSEVFGQ